MTRFPISLIFRMPCRSFVLAAVVFLLSWPVFAQTITTSNLGVNQVTLGLKASSSGTGSFTILTGSAACGTAAQTVQGKDSSGTAAYRRGSLSLAAGVTGNYTVRNLTASTTYTVCFTPDGTSAPVTGSFTTQPFTQPSTGAWNAVGARGFSGVQTSSNNLAIAPDGTPYVAFSDLSTAGGGRLTVEKFDGAAWVVVGSPNFSAGFAQGDSLAFAPDGTPYVAYQDFSVNSATTVQRFDGTAWQVVGAVGFSSYGQWPVTTYQSLAFAPDGTPYVAYYDGGASTYSGAATVSAFVGGQWQVVGTRGFSQGVIDWISLAFAPDGSPWVAMGDNADKPVNEGAATVEKFDGKQWTIVGAAAFSGSSDTEHGSLAFSPTGTPYVAYSDQGNNWNAVVRKFDGSNWVMVGTPQDSFDNGTSLAFSPDGAPFLAFPGTLDSYKAAATVERFDGSAWNLVGQQGFSDSVSNLKLVFAPDGIPYAGYEDDANGGNATVSSFAPELTIAPGSITFPSTAVRSASAVMTATISYTGSAAIYLTQGMLTDSTDFTQSDNCGGIVVANGTCAVSFTFTPQSAGALTSTYTIADRDNAGSPLTVTLSGTGTANYGLTLSPTAITFPATKVGLSSSLMTATLTLHGGSTRANLTAGTLTDSTDFTQSDDCGGSISPNGSCTITFTFTPKSVGALTSTYSIALQSGGSPVTVALAGTGTGAPEASFSPASLSFTTIAGTQAAAQTVTLSNAGNAVLYINSLSLEGTDTGQFVLGSTNCGTSLAAGSSCSIPVSCTSTAYGSYSASLVLNSNASPSTSSVALSCNVNGSSAATLSPASKDYGRVTAGTATSAATFTLTNTGTLPLSINSIALGGAAASSFKLAGNTCASSLAVGAACTASVTFAPVSSGSFTASLIVNDAAGTQSSTLIGSAVAPSVPPDFTISASPSSQSSFHGQSVTYQVKLASLLDADPFMAPVHLSVTGLPPGATASFSPSSVIPGTGEPVAQFTVNLPALKAQTSDKELHAPLLAFLLGWPVLLLPLRHRGARQKLSRFSLLVAIAVCSSGLFVLSGCGSGNGFATPTATYHLIITGAGGSTAHTTTVTLTVK